MREINLATWNRAMHWQIFRNSVQPQYCVTFELDITNLLRRIKERGYSFTFSFVFAVTKCANEIEEFRCRFWEGKPVIYDKINTSFTYLDNGSELFKVVNVEMQDTIEEYVSLAARTVREQKECFTAPMGNDIFRACHPLQNELSRVYPASPYQVKHCAERMKRIRATQRKRKQRDNQLTINQLKENQRKGVSGEQPAPFGRYKNLFLSESEYAELKGEYPDRLERFIEELSEFIAAYGKVYTNHAAAVRMWAKRDRKGTGKKGIPDYSYKEGESL